MITRLRNAAYRGLAPEWSRDRRPMCDRTHLDRVWCAVIARGRDGAGGDHKTNLTPRWRESSATGLKAPRVAVPPNQLQWRTRPSQMPDFLLPNEP